MQISEKSYFSHITKAANSFCKIANDFQTQKVAETITCNRSMEAHYIHFKPMK